MTHAEDKPSSEPPDLEPTPPSGAAASEAEVEVEATEEVTPPAETGAEAAASAADEPAPAESQAPSAADAPAESEATSPAGAPAESAAAEAPPSPPAKAVPARSEAMARMIALKESGEPVEGKVIGWNRGGFHVSLDGVTAFCPRSMMEIGNPHKPESYLDQTYSFRIAEIHEKARRVVVSRQELLQAERREARQEVRSQLEVGATMKGRVDSITDFGAFVNIGGGLRGLVHLSEMSRKRVGHPNEVVSTGDEVQVQITRLEKGGDRISLSLKALEPDPWEGIEDRHPRGSAFQGKVLRHSDFGLFVEVEPGVEGLVHVSQLPIGGKLEDAAFADESSVEGWVREVDLGRQRLSLTLRELPESDPWQDVGKRLEDGAVVEGVVEQVTRFGFFVELEPGLTGLLPFAVIDAPAGRRKEQAYRAGQRIKVQIMQIEARRRRISLGLEGSTVGGTKTDLKNYMQKQEDRSGGGLNALAAAFEKLKAGSGDAE